MTSIDDLRARMVPPIKGGKVLAVDFGGTEAVIYRRRWGGYSVSLYRDGAGSGFAKNTGFRKFSQVRDYIKREST